MNNENFQTIFDCGSSKVRAGIFNKNNQNEAFYAESNFFTYSSDLELKIQNIISSFEKDTNEHLNNIDLMVDSSKMLSIGISTCKKLDGSKLTQPNVKFLVQEAKQQIIKYYKDYSIAHIIINNYKIDNIDYFSLPDEIQCNLISLDILFICLPADLVRYFKNIFSKTNISINKIICSSYAKAINYKDKLNLTGNILFVDVGFSKTSVISCFNDKILSLNILPIGGNHITKDISKILEIDLEQAEQIKLNFSKSIKPENNEKISIEMLKKIIFSRTEEILELSAKSAELNSLLLGQFKMVLMGEGSKILNNHYKDKISFSNDIDFLEETLENICQSGFEFRMGLNKQEVLMIAKKQIKQGFFEKLFLFNR